MIGTKKYDVRQGENGTADGPFALGDNAAYRRWRAWKLDTHPRDLSELVVSVRDPLAPTVAELEALRSRVGRANMALYDTGAAAPEDPAHGKAAIKAMGAGLGLHRLDNNLHADDDGITPLHDASGAGGIRTRYIPYSDRPIRWHTDGYYNTLDRQILGLSLHCSCDSAAGGENRLMDHEIAYIVLRDEDPDHIRALMHEQAMTIPGNVEDGTEVRPDRAGPVFMVMPGLGTLHMRYTRRARNVIWRDDPALRRAVARLEAVFDGDSPYVFRHRMTPGQGLVSNNVLHDRAGFVDDRAAGRVRLLFRARYFDRIAGTALADVFPG